MKITFDLRIQLAKLIADSLTLNGLECLKAQYAAVIIVEESMWKLKSRGLATEEEPDDLSGLTS